MTELVKVEVKNGEQLVSARELHEFLEVGRDFSTWIKDRINKYGFEEGVDFIVLWSDTKTGDAVEFNGNVNSMVAKGFNTNYILKLSMAKELSMVENNDKGSMARKYFIECERKLKEVTVDSYMIEDKVERAKKWIEEEETRKRLELEVKEKAEVIKEQAPKVEYYEKVLRSDSTFTTTQVAKSFGMSAMGLNKLLEVKGIQFYQSGMWHLYSEYQDKGYAKVRTYDIGNNKTRKATVWTEVGVEFISKILEEA